MKILIIQLKQIGDVLLVTPIANSLKKILKESEIHFITYDISEGVLLKNPNIDKIICITKKERTSKIEFLKFLSKIRKENYDVVINAQGKLEGFLITLFSGASIRVGFDKKFWKIANTVSVNPSKYIKITGISGNTVDERLTLVDGLREKIKGISGEYVRELKIWLDEEEVTKFRNKMKSCGVNFDKITFAFGVTTSKIHKYWPKEYYAQVADYLAEKYDANIILFYAPKSKEYSKEFEYCKSLYDIVKNKKNVFINIETKNVRELLNLLKNCDFYLGNDNGPRHLSQALDIPTLAIFPPTEDRFGFTPHNNPKFYTIDLKRVLSEEDYKKIEHELVNLKEDEGVIKYLKMIKPEFVIKQIEIMKEQFL